MNSVNADRKPKKAHIWYDGGGLIVAVGHALERTEKAGDAPLHRRATPLILQDQFLLEAEVPGEMIQELHSTHRVDLRTRTLVAQHKTG